MRLLTWNLNGLDDVCLDERTEAAVFIAVTGLTLRQLSSGHPPRPAPDVLMFQEVTPHTFNAHLAMHLPRGGYTLSPSTPPERETFEVIALRTPAVFTRVASSPLDRSVFGRYLNIADIDGVTGLTQPIRVITAHFDSGPEAGAVRIDECRQTMRAMTPRSVFAGDTNMRNAEWEALGDSAAALGFSDMWEAMGAPPDLRRTWRMAGRGARFDRVWLGSGLRPVELTAVGSATLPGLGRSPSDHIGLLAEIVEAPDCLDAGGNG